MEPKGSSNVAYADILNLLKVLPQHDEAIAFAYLSDTQPCPHDGCRIHYPVVAACIMPLELA